MMNLLTAKYIVSNEMM